MQQNTDSTSIHSLNADLGLNRLQAVLYFALNHLNNAFPNYSVDRQLKNFQFTAFNLQEHWSVSPNNSSPSRKLSDLFWLSLPWERIKAELGEISVLDIGCGSGGYGKRLAEWSNSRIANYIGLDINQHANWEQLSQNYGFHFYAKNVCDFPIEKLENTNLLISQSSLEHIAEDLSIFRRIQQYVRAYKKSIIQIHLIPSSACLRLYRLHGIRQYTPRTASKIFAMFKSNAYGILFGLGGKACCDLHDEFITKPAEQSQPDRRTLYPEEYNQRLRHAVELDMKTSEQYPAFYALVIHSNFKSRLFEELAGEPQN